MIWIHSCGGEKHIKLAEGEGDGLFCFKILNGNVGNFQRFFHIFKLDIIYYTYDYFHEIKKKSVFTHILKNYSEGLRSERGRMIFLRRDLEERCGGGRGWREVWELEAFGSPEEQQRQRRVVPMQYFHPDKRRVHCPRGKLGCSDLEFTVLRGRQWPLTIHMWKPSLWNVAGSFTTPSFSVTFVITPSFRWISTLLLYTRTPGLLSVNVSWLISPFMCSV